MATSFSIQGTSATPAMGAGGWQEGLALPAAVPGSGSLDLTAGVGHLPAVLAILAGAMRENRWGGERRERRGGGEGGRKSRGMLGKGGEAEGKDAPWHKAGGAMFDEQ